MSLSAGSGKAPELSSVRDLVNEASHKLWLAFLEGEKKQSYRLPWEIPTQIQSVTNVSKTPFDFVLYFDLSNCLYKCNFFYTFGFFLPCLFLSVDGSY